MCACGPPKHSMCPCQSDWGAGFRVSPLTCPRNSSSPADNTLSGFSAVVNSGRSRLLTPTSNLLQVRLALLPQCRRFCWCGGSCPTPLGARGSFLAQHSGIIPGGDWGTMWCLGRSLGCSFQGQHHAHCSVAHPLKCRRRWRCFPCQVVSSWGIFISDAQPPPGAPVSRAVPERPEFQCSAALLSHQPVSAAVGQSEKRVSL